MMPRTGEKHGCQSVTPNTFSNIPENVIDDILMRLPLRDAVRTSILSIRNGGLIGADCQSTLDERHFPLIFPPPIFADIVCHLLTYHEGSITKFSLFLHYLERRCTLDNLIYYLSRSGIQHLVLQLPYCGPLYDLPSSFYTCLQMRHLTIENCEIHPPPAFKGFDRLISLELREVSICSEFLESFISHSPLLQYLVLRIPEMFEDIQMIAPNLKSLDFVGNDNSIFLKDTPLLVKLSLVRAELSVEHERLGLAKLFESFPALEHLHLDHPSVGSLVAGTAEVPKELPSVLKCLYLSDICVDEEFTYVFLCLLRSLPYLQEAEIQVDTFEISNDWWFGEVPGFVTPVEVEGFSDVALNHLRAVKFKGITGTKPEMQLIKLLLAKSPILKRMLIEPDLRVPKESLELLRELTQFRRASPNAEVVYKVTKR